MLGLLLSLILANIQMGGYMSKGQTFSEMDLKEFMLQLFKARYYLFIGAVLGLLAAAIFLFVSIPHYSAKMVLAPSLSMDSISAGRSGLTSSQERFSFEAQTIAAPSQLYFERFQEVMKGHAVASLMLQDRAIIDGLKRDNSFVFTSEKSDWDSATLAEYVQKRVTVDPVGETVMRGYGYAHIDGEFARLFLSKLHAVTDRVIRSDVSKNLNARLDYLRTSLQRAGNSENRKIYADLMAEQERMMMFISLPEPFSASVVEKAYVRSKIYWPSYGLVLFVFTAIGGICAALYYGFAVYKPEFSDVDLVQEQESEDVQKTQTLRDRARSLRQWVRRDYKNSNDSDKGDEDDQYKPSNAAE